MPNGQRLLHVVADRIQWQTALEQARRRAADRFDIEPDPLTGKRRQVNGSGYRTEREAWKECRAAMADHEKGRLVSSSRRKVGEALEEWLTRIEHSIKPSMVQNWRNYAAYYVVPYIGQRDVQEINGAVCDALYAKLLAEGRVKAKPKKRSSTQAVHTRRLVPDGREMPCRPYSYDTVRCYRTHAENDPLIGQPIKSKKLGRRAAEDASEAAQRKLSPRLEPKTVVNTHRMLHRAWEDERRRCLSGLPCTNPCTNHMLEALFSVRETASGLGSGGGI
jgi:hypothetical protein